MPRRARIILANVPHHIFRRGNNRSACFYADYQIYLGWLEKYSLLYSYCTYILVTRDKLGQVGNYE